jgi:hypothetical protein
VVSEAVDLDDEPLHRPQEVDLQTPHPGVDQRPEKPGRADEPEQAPFGFGARRRRPGDLDERAKRPGAGAPTIALELIEKGGPCG